MDGFERQGFAIERYCLLVVFLVSFKKSEMREGLRSPQG